MKRLIALDTNVIVSVGINATGAPSQIVSKVLEGELISAVCPSIVREYTEVLSRPKFKQFGLPLVWLSVLLQESHFSPKEPPEFATEGPDLDDLVFLNLAAYLGAILITGIPNIFPRRPQNMWRCFYLQSTCRFCTSP